MDVLSSKLTPSIRILHIEDSIVDERIIRTALYDCVVNIKSIDVATTISEALKFLHSFEVDLVLLDLNLSDSMGLDTLKTLKNNFPSLAVLIISGADDEAAALESITMGAQDYLVKDFISKYTLGRSIQYSLERNRHEQQLFELANTDPLTQLPNRGHFTQFLNQHLNRPTMVAHDFALVYIDCDKFKVINDTLGHHAADQFLIQLSLVIKSFLSKKDFLARVGGDEFVIALNVSIFDSQKPKVVAEKIITALRDGIHISEQEKISCTCSIGIAKAKLNRDEFYTEKLINQAVSAMFAAKKRGGDCFNSYNKSLEVAAARRIYLLKLVNGGFKKGEFFLNHQLIYSAKSHHPIGMESLLRWKNAQGEYISPLEFIPILEETGLIFPIGLWVIKQACIDYLDLIGKDLLPKKSWVSVNVSPLQLQDDNFANKVRKVLISLNMPASHLHLEITETLMMQKRNGLLSELQKLKKLGCHLSIDDFGVGYSSMNYLKELPFDTLKIDQSFILSYANRKSEKAILKAMIALAHNLGKKVVAEGVENQRAAEFLSAQHCDYLQGYFFAMPENIKKIRSDLQPLKVQKNKRYAS